MSYKEILRGYVTLGYMDRSMVDFARRIRQCIIDEQENINPNNVLIGVLCDAARVGWELLEETKVNEI